MSKRKARQKMKSMAQPVSNPKRRTMSRLIIGLILILAISGGILARWRSLSNLSSNAVVEPIPEETPEEEGAQGTTSVTLAKEYIYVGGKMVAIEEKARGTATSGGIEPDPTPEPTPPPIYTNMAVWRPSNGSWYVLNITNGSLIEQLWGQAGDKPVPGDYDGDGKLDFSVYRPSNSIWYILRSSNGAVDGPQFGQTGDEPVPGDYDGDGRTDIAVRRGSTWYIRHSSDPTGSIVTQQWGDATDVAVPGDYDGDGKTDLATFRPSDGTWTILKSSSPEDEPQTITQQWGESGDLTVTGDYDGDGATDCATFRTGDTNWRLLMSFDSSDQDQTNDQS